MIVQCSIKDYLGLSAGDANDDGKLFDLCKFIIRLFSRKKLIGSCLVFCQEIVPLRKVCRRPETDYRLQQLYAVNEAASAEQQKSSTDTFGGGALKTSIPAETTPKQQHADAALVAPALHATAALATKTSILEPKKVEIVNVVDAGNSNNVTASGNGIMTGSPASNKPIVSGEQMPEGKAVG